MEIIINTSGTNFAAWWGAIVATIVLAWDVVKWFTSGLRLRLQLSPNMIPVGIPGRENEKLISLTVSNVGDKPTTISKVFLLHYKSYWQVLRNNPNTQYYIANPTVNDQSLPRILNIGEEWLGGIIQDEDAEQKAKEGVLICHVYHSCNKKSLKQKIKIGDNGT